MHESIMLCRTKWRMGDPAKAPIRPLMGSAASRMNSCLGLSNCPNVVLLCATVCYWNDRE